MAANDDTARLLVSIEATQAKFEKQLASIAKAAEKAARNTENAFKGANDNIAKNAENSGRKVERSLGAQRAAVSNLSFQLNDIAMGLASGTSPFTIMVQQGSQVSQVLQGSGGIVGAVKTLGGAFASMVSPVSLASFALIGLTGAAVQYLTTLSSGVPDSEILLKEHANVIKSFDEAWGIAEKGVKEYSDATKQVELQKLKDKFGDLAKTAESTFEDVTRGLRNIPASEFGGGDIIDQTNKAMSLLEQQVPALREFAAEMIKLENAKDAPQPVREAAAEARKLAQELFPVQDALEETQRRLKVINVTGEQAKETFAAMTAAALGMGTAGGDAVTTIASKVKNDLIPVMTQAIQQVAEYAKNFSSLQAQVNKTPLGQLSPIFSGGGQFLNEDQLNTFRAGEEKYRIAGESAAAQMVKGFEGFIAKAKWDENAFRVGFGSDTVTRTNGQIEKVTKDTVVTLADAQRDLERRLVEFQDGIQKAIGVDTWNSLNEAQQAALTSIAYNYGSLPKRIVAAIESGGGAEAVANAISALGSDNGGINKRRRNEEAQSFLSGTGISMSEAGLSGGKKTPAELFQGDVQQIQARIAALNAEYEAQARLNPLVNDYGYAVEKARIQQQLLSEAQRAGLEITPELRTQIEGLAENYAKASSASDRLKDSQQKAVDAAKQFSGLGQEVVGGFISDMRNGASAAEALSNALNKVLDKIIEIGLNSLFSGGGLFGGGGGKGGLLGGFLIPGILHSGGVAGSDGYGHGRSVSPSTFAGAKRYHTGGVAGLQPGEVPAILQRGEVVLPRGTKMGGQQAVQVQVGVSVDNDGQLQAYVKSVSQQEVASASPKIVSAANQQAPAAMAKYQATKAGGEWR
ncbi:phage tail length tape measure family protein [Ensifer sp. YR511]|uniref:phage tail length tape measure family protein n=1 Tax=Ensifer sp. YR511 TaxID=1855294 RepID=UPI0008909AEB|nr:phage tail length tape measure family protein [Ensifer sp. YR511]SDN84656.1 Phage-related lysozyme (muramidase), GH24 family [Ensifer sp. YR511]